MLRFLLLYSFSLTIPAEARGKTAEKLVILSSHRKSIQREFITAFRDHYKKTFKMIFWSNGLTRVVQVVI